MDLYLVRHGETEWSLSGQHTGLTDIPLTTGGEADARGLSTRLAGVPFSHVFTSPLQRAARTCELAHLSPTPEVDPDLAEWNYGAFDGLTTAEIHKQEPDWNLFRDGCPGGESPTDVTTRVDRFIARVRALDGNVAAFSHGHLGRVLAARWLGLPLHLGGHFLLGTASVSQLRLAGAPPQPAIVRWNVGPVA